MLELKNVKKSYDGTPVLTDISLNIEDGEIVSILGPSGCGKTTLLNLILGIVMRTADRSSTTGKISRMYRWRSGASISYSRIMLCSRT